MYSLREVKKEIRVLGIAARSRQDSENLAVGVVFRGRLYLDGVMVTSAEGPDITDDVASMIEESPHRPQIRVILLDESLLRDGVEVDPVGLSNCLSKPVIVLNAKGNPPPGGMHTRAFTYRHGDAETLCLSVGLPEKTASQALKVSSPAGGTPEALRVSEIIVSAVCDK